jgi:hypothetical protein
MAEDRYMQATPAEAAKIKDADSYDALLSYLHERQEGNGQIKRNERGQFVAADSSEHKTDPAESTDPGVISEDVVIGGTTFTFKGKDRDEVQAQIAAAAEVFTKWKAAQPAPQPAPPVQRPTAREAQRNVADRVELDLKFKRGDLTTAEYLEKSGAFEEYLQNQGLSIDALRTVSDRGYTQSWAEATEKFLNSEAGKDWPGSDKNRDILGLKLVELGLTDAPDKVAALTTAYNELKSKKLLHPYEPPGAEKAAEELEAIKAQIDSGDLSPAELLDAWKQEQLKAGLTPQQINDEFQRVGGSSRRASSLFSK